MSWLTDMFADAAPKLSHLEHMALALLHRVANGEATLDNLSTDHPLVAEAIRAGTDIATANGVPVLTIERQVIAAAKELDGILSGVTA